MGTGIIQSFFLLMIFRHAVGFLFNSPIYWTVHDNKKFIINSEPQEWKSARNYCLSQGLDFLVPLHTPAYDKFFQEYFVKQHLAKHPSWFVGGPYGDCSRLAHSSGCAKYVSSGFGKGIYPWICGGKLPFICGPKCGQKVTTPPPTIAVTTSALPSTTTNIQSTVRPGPSFLPVNGTERMLANFQPGIWKFALNLCLSQGLDLLVPVDGPTAAAVATGTRSPAWFDGKQPENCDGLSQRAKCTRLVTTKLGKKVFFWLCHHNQLFFICGPKCGTA